MKRTETTTAFIVAIIATMAACDGLQVPQKVTWAEHVKPIVAAKCVHCHGYPAIQGAPNTFRLDVFEDTTTADGRVIFGAAQMVASIGTRIDHDALDGFGVKPYSIPIMPPAPASLSDAQRQILLDWANPLNWENGRPLRGTLRGNRAPTLELTQPLDSSLDGDLLTIHYDLRDPDGETVAGVLRVGNSASDSVVVGPLGLGPGQIVWDTGQFDNNTTYALVAVVEDGSGSHDIDMGSYQISRTDANLAPTVSFVTPARDTVMGDAVQSLAITVNIGDTDAGDSHTLSVRAATDGAFIRIADDAPAAVGDNSFTWNTTGVPARIWRLEATASDGTATRTVTSRPIRVSHEPATVDFQDVSGLFLKCAECHGGTGLPGPEFDPLDRSMLGRVYQRVVLQRNMPPESYRTYNSDATDPQLTPEERDMIGQWILSGAPGVP